MPDGKPVNNNFPCVSMMDWRGNGSDTARTWALQLTIDVLGNGEKHVSCSQGNLHRCFWLMGWF